MHKNRINIAHFSVYLSTQESSEFSTNSTIAQKTKFILIPCIVIKLRCASNNYSNSKDLYNNTQDLHTHATKSETYFIISGITRITKSLIALNSLLFPPKTLIYRHLSIMDGHRNLIGDYSISRSKTRYREVHCLPLLLSEIANDNRRFAVYEYRDPWPPR